MAMSRDPGNHAARRSRFAWLSGLHEDVRYGLRAALRSPVFSSLAVVTLALGLGANAAVFGVVKSVLLDALPYTEAERLVRVYSSRMTGWQEGVPVSAGTAADLAERQRSFERLAAFASLRSDVVYGSDERGRAARAAWVEPGFFGTLGVAAERGRTFREQDAANGLAVLNGGGASEAAPSVLLTHGAWQRLLGGEADVVGRRLLVDGVARTVVGVLPRGFVGPMGEADFYFAFDLGPVAADPVVGRGSHWLGVVGRLGAGISYEAARREVAAIGAELAGEYPSPEGTRGLAAVPLRETMVGDTRTPLLVLMGSAVLVLLIACTNLAGALLSRTLTRRKEFALRASLGAGRARIVRQILVESTLLALAGGAAGLLVAGGIRSLLRETALPALPAFAAWSLDGGAALAVAALSVCAGVAFGLAPAIAVSRADTQGTLREASRGASESRRARRLRGALVAGQIALCLSLLMGAGLLTRSLWAMTNAPLGFEPQRVLAVSLQLPPGEDDSRAAPEPLHAQFVERLRGLPGVDAVANASALPTAVMNRMGLEIAGAPDFTEDGQPFVLYASVSDEYFDVLGIPVRAGRVFDARDHADAAPTVVISERMARRYWPGGGALGSRIRLGPDPGSPLMEVVGIVGDVRNDRARPDAEPMAYRSSRQSPWPVTNFLLRMRGAPLDLVGPVEAALTELEPGLAIQSATPLPAVLGEGLAARRLPVLLMSAFGALALVLASVGVYAMFAAMAATREWEFGVRMALGSRPGAIAALVLRQGAGWMAVGLAGGVVGVVWVGYALRDLLYEVPSFDPIALGVAVAAIVVCAAAALLVPLRRATRVDPATALRAQ